MAPSLTVIVPVYNTCPYLEYCLRALENQVTDESYEVILVDDGSTDESGSVCDRFVEKNPRLFRVLHTENGGLCAARNAGLSRARGEWIAFCDSDDIPYSTFVFELLNIAGSDPECDVACLSYDRIDERGRRHRAQFEGLVGSRESVGAMRELLTDTHVRGYVWDKVFRRSVLSDNGIHFYSFRAGFEDLAFVSGAFLYARKILFDSIPILGYRDHREGSLTRGGLGSDRLIHHISSYFASRAYADRRLGCEEASRLFKSMERHIAQTLYSDVIFGVKTPGRSRGDEIRFIHMAKSWLVQKDIPYKGYPWEKHVLDTGVEYPDRATSESDS